MKRLSVSTLAQALVKGNCTLKDCLAVIDKAGFGFAVLENEIGQFQRVVTDGDIRRLLVSNFPLESRLEDVLLTEESVVCLISDEASVASYFNETVRIVPVIDNKRQLVQVYYADVRGFVPVYDTSFGIEELQNVSDCLQTGWISPNGKYSKRFATDLAEISGVDFCELTSSGTTALHLAMLALNIGPGDEVIVPSLSFIATANAVRYVGATPVFADVSPFDWNLDVCAAEKLINSNTKAIILVHLYGVPGCVSEFRKLADENDLFFIEDCAEAQGAEVDGAPVGSFGDISCFSFFGNKVISTGEGGCVLTNDAGLADRVSLFKNHGMRKSERYKHLVLGYNYRMTDIQAAVGCAQLSKLPGIVAKKIEIGEMYKHYLDGLPLDTPFKTFDGDTRTIVYWLYSFKILDSKPGCRDKLSEFLALNNVDSRPVFPLIHSQPSYRQSLDLEHSSKISADSLSLPSSPLLTEENIKNISHLVVEWCNKNL